MGEFLANNKALFLKILIWGLGAAFNWVNIRWKLGIDPVGLATSTAALILGIAIHAGMKDHGVTVANLPDAPDKPEVKQ